MYQNAYLVFYNVDNVNVDFLCQSAIHEPAKYQAKSLHHEI